MRFKDLMLNLYNHAAVQKSELATPMEDTFFFMQQALYESMTLEQQLAVQKWIEERINR